MKQYNHIRPHQALSIRVPLTALSFDLTQTAHTHWSDKTVKIGC